MSTVTGPGAILGVGDWFAPEAAALIGSECPGCGTQAFPGGAFCWRCGAPTARMPLPRTGTVVARSRVHVGPPGFPDRYDVGVVALSDDLHIFARFGEPVSEHGAPVTVTTGFLRTEADRPVYGPVFAPGGGPASRQAGEARRGPATAGPAAWTQPSPSAPTPPSDPAAVWSRLISAARWRAWG
jgi:uncharacterized OB-fold protein